MEGIIIVFFLTFSEYSSSAQAALFGKALDYALSDRASIYANRFMDDGEEMNLRNYLSYEEYEHFFLGSENSNSFNNQTFLSAGLFMDEGDEEEKQAKASAKDELKADEDTALRFLTNLDDAIKVYAGFVVLTANAGSFKINQYMPKDTFNHLSADIRRVSGMADASPETPLMLTYAMKEATMKQLEYFSEAWKEVKRAVFEARKGGERLYFLTKGKYVKDVSNDPRKRFKDEFLKRAKKYAKRGQDQFGRMKAQWAKAVQALQDLSTTFTSGNILYIKSMGALTQRLEQLNETITKSMATEDELNRNITVIENRMNENKKKYDEYQAQKNKYIEMIPTSFQKHKMYLEKANQKMEHDKAILEGQRRIAEANNPKPCSGVFFIKICKRKKRAVHANALEHKGKGINDPIILADMRVLISGPFKVASAISQQIKKGKIDEACRQIQLIRDGVKVTNTVKHSIVHFTDTKAKRQALKNIKAEEQVVDQIFKVCKKSQRRKRFIGAVMAGINVLNKLSSAAGSQTRTTRAAADMSGASAALSKNVKLSGGPEPAKDLNDDKVPELLKIAKMNKDFEASRIRYERSAAKYDENKMAVNHQKYLRQIAEDSRPGNEKKLKYLKKTSESMRYVSAKISTLYITLRSSLGSTINEYGETFGNLVSALHESLFPSVAAKTTEKEDKGRTDMPEWLQQDNVKEIEEPRTKMLQYGASLADTLSAVWKKMIETMWKTLREAVDATRSDANKQDVLKKLSLTGKKAAETAGKVAQEDQKEAAKFRQKEEKTKKILNSVKTKNKAVFDKVTQETNAAEEIVTDMHKGSSQVDPDDLLSDFNL